MILRIYFILIFIVTAPSLFGQKHRTSHSSDIEFASKLYRNDFFNSLNTIDSYNINSPVHLIGISRSGKMLLSRGEDFDGHFSYCQILPKRIRINDTIQPIIKGFIFGFGYGRDLFRGSKSIDMIASIGFNTGRIKLSDKESINQVNPYFAPKISLQPRLNFNKISISFRVEYEYDISRSNWLNRSNQSTQYRDVNNFNQTSLICFASIGYSLAQKPPWAKYQQSSEILCSFH